MLGGEWGKEGKSSESKRLQSEAEKWRRKLKCEKVSEKKKTRKRKMTIVTAKET